MTMKQKVSNQHEAKRNAKMQKNTSIVTLTVEVLYMVGVICAWYFQKQKQNKKKKEKEKNNYIFSLCLLAVCKWSENMPMWHTGKQLTSNSKHFNRTVSTYLVVSRVTIHLIVFVACKQSLLAENRFFAIVALCSVTFGLRASSKGNIFDTLL